MIRRVITKKRLGALPLINTISLETWMKRGFVGYGSLGHDNPVAGDVDRYIDIYAVCIFAVPSGKLSHNYGKSQCLIGKLTINGHVQ